MFSKLPFNILVALVGLSALQVVTAEIRTCRLSGGDSGPHGGNGSSTGDGFGKDHIGIFRCCKSRPSLPEDTWLTKLGPPGVSSPSCPDKPRAGWCVFASFSYLFIFWRLLIHVALTIAAPLVLSHFACQYISS
jgi:hypothetical protein